MRTSMKDNNRGDTIIEVLLAVAVFSLVSVGAMIIMNQGTATAQRAVEITLVRMQIDAQAEALRAVHQAAGKSDTAKPVWQSIISGADSSAPSAAVVDGTCPDPSGGAFFLDPVTMQTYEGDDRLLSATDGGAPPYAQVVVPDSGLPTAYGLWIEPVRMGGDTNAGTPDAYDFYIRTCWHAPGSSAPMTIGTVVRLYSTLQPVTIAAQNSNPTNPPGNPGDIPGDDTEIGLRPICGPGSNPFQLCTGPGPSTGRFKFFDQTVIGSTQGINENNIVGCEWHLGDGNTMQLPVQGNPQRGLDRCRTGGVQPAYTYTNDRHYARWNDEPCQNRDTALDGTHVPLTKYEVSLTLIMQGGGRIQSDTIRDIWIPNCW